MIACIVLSLFSPLRLFSGSFGGYNYDVDYWEMNNTVQVSLTTMVGRD